MPRMTGINTDSSPAAQNAPPTPWFSSDPLKGRLSAHHERHWRASGPQAGTPVPRDPGPAGKITGKGFTHPTGKRKKRAGTVDKKAGIGNNRKGETGTFTGGLNEPPKSPSLGGLAMLEYTPFRG